MRHAQTCHYQVKRSPAGSKSRIVVSCVSRRHVPPVRPAVDAVKWQGGDGSWTAFGPKRGDGGSWRLGSVVRYRESHGERREGLEERRWYWRAFLVLDPIGDYPTADEARAAVEAAVKAAERE